MNRNKNKKDLLPYSLEVTLSKSEEFHNFLCSLFLFDFDAKRKSGTEKEKHELLNGTSYQGLCPRTPIPSYDILRLKPQYDYITNDKKDNKNVKNLLPYSLNALLPKKKLAFTLAEVLITLGIIGIVAAMTIPTLMQKYYEKQTVSRLKETYSILTQALKLCGEENGYPEEWGLTGRNEESTAIVAEKIMPYLKINIDCGMKMEKSDKCFPDSVQRLNGAGGKIYLLSKPKYFVSLLNGTSLDIESGEGAGIYLYFLVDTNGAAPPNTWGKDIFEFTYRPSLGLVPSGHPNNTSNSYKTHCNNLSHIGYGCAYYVINFGDMEYLHRKP